MEQWINTLEDYICHSLPSQGDFVTRPSLLEKVSADGRLLPFAGNTVVFLLDSQAQNSLNHLQDELYDQAGEMLAQRLDAATMHLTVHDLCNPATCPDDLPRQMLAVQEKVLPILEQFRSQPAIHLTASWMFNMVNTSVVLGFRPADADSAQSLAALYQTLEAVVPLGYALTPHVTLAYFKPGTYTQAQLARLQKALRPVQLSMTLSMQQLVLQTFTDMNHYSTA